MPGPRAEALPHLPADSAEAARRPPPAQRTCWNLPPPDRLLQGSPRLACRRPLRLVVCAGAVPGPVAPPQETTPDAPGGGRLGARRANPVLQCEQDIMTLTNCWLHVSIS